MLCSCSGIGIAIGIWGGRWRGRETVQEREEEREIEGPSARQSAGDKCPKASKRNVDKAGAALGQGTEDCAELTLVGRGRDRVRLEEPALALETRELIKKKQKRKEYATNEQGILFMKYFPLHAVEVGVGNRFDLQLGSLPEPLRI